MSGIPLQSNCDPNKPEEFALWAMVAEAGPSSHAPLIFPPAVNKKRSEELWKKGFRHHPELQEIFYIPPHSDANFIEGAAGRWVDKDTYLTPQDTAPRIDGLTPAEMKVLRDELNSKLKDFEPRYPDGDVEVENG